MLLICYALSFELISFLALIWLVHLSGTVQSTATSFQDSSRNAWRSSLVDAEYNSTKNSELVNFYCCSGLFMYPSSIVWNTRRLAVVITIHSLVCTLLDRYSYISYGLLWWHHVFTCLVCSNLFVSVFPRSRLTSASIFQVFMYLYPVAGLALDLASNMHQFWVLQCYPCNSEA